MELDLELVYADIVASEKMILEYETTKIRRLKNISAYHIQQAVEKLIKFQICKNASNYNDRNMYTHNIGALIRYSQSLGISIYVPPDVAAKAIVITSWEAASRYDCEFTVRIDTLKKMQAVLVAWYEYICEVYKK